MGMRSARLVILAAVLLASAACGLIASLSDDYRVEGRATGDGDGAIPKGDAGAEGSTPPPPEDCLDGVDDDGDGLVDCQDPQCVDAGYTCVDAPPQGWDGVAVNRRDPADPTVAPGCGDAGTATIYYEGLAAAPTACAPCACSKPDGGGCYATFGCYGDTTCGGAAKPPTPVVVGPKCTPQATVGGANSCKVVSTSPDGGACTPEGGALSAPIPWTHRDDLCATGVVGGKGCQGTQVCVNRGTSVPQIACLRARTDLACPAGWNATVSLYPKSGIVDQRSCTPCTCGAPAGAGCSGATVTVNSKPDCTGSTSSDVTGCSAANAVQVTVQSAAWGAIAKNATLNPGTCPPQGGQPSGAFDAGAPESFCCAP